MNTVGHGYLYVGPEAIRVRSANSLIGIPINSNPDLKSWLTAQGADRFLAGTYIVDLAGRLRLADRHAEHVACAGGEAVLAAGEIFFRRDDDIWRVVEVTNQSTGYCPEPTCWPTVAAALDRIGVSHPGHFTREFIFRRCPGCSQINIVKDGWFVCAVCGAVLPR